MKRICNSFRLVGKSQREERRDREGFSEIKIVSKFNHYININYKIKCPIIILIESLVSKRAFSEMSNFWKTFLKIDK